MKRRTMTRPVHEVMTRAPITVAPGTTVEELLSLFERHDFNAFPVVDEWGALRGIVTKLDLLRMLRPDRNLRIPNFDAISSQQVDDIMRHGVITVEPEDPIVVAADLMVETKLRSLPVVERRSGNPALVGMVSRGDVLRGLRFELVEEFQRPHKEAKR